LERFAWLQQVVFGLAAEWNQSPMEVLVAEEQFVRTIRFSTEWAQRLFPRVAIDAKTEETADLLSLLSGG
jgi:hypothetical protein